MKRNKDKKRVVGKVVMHVDEFEKVNGHPKDKLELSDAIQEILDNVFGIARPKIEDGPKDNHNCARPKGADECLRLDDVKRRRKPDADPVNHPSHYKSSLGVECADLIEDRLGLDIALGFYLGNAFKYLFRCTQKQAFEQDVRKAHWYLNRASKLFDISHKHD